MKSNINQTPKTLPNKKTVKPLNQKKNSTILQPALRKQKSKTNLVLTDNSQISTSSLIKATSPKNINFTSSSIILKTQGNDQIIKGQKSDLKKTSITNNRIKKTGITKHEPIKKQFLQSMKSPKNGKISTIQSAINLNSQTDNINFNEQSHLTIELQTSILKTQQYDDQIVQDNFRLSQMQQKSMIENKKQKIEQVSKTSKQQNEQILRLRQKNEQLQRKLTKMKQSQQQNRKKLKQRISSFNEQGQQIKSLKQKIIQLEKRIISLEQENYKLSNNKNGQILGNQKELLQVNSNKQISTNLNYFSAIFDVKIQSFNIKISKQTKNMMIDQSVMTSLQDELCQGMLSFMNGSGSNNLQQSVLLTDRMKDSQNGSLSFIPVLQIQVIKNNYQQKYKQKIGQLQNLYKQGIKTIQNRFNLLLSQNKQIVKSQQQQIISLQNKLDSLYDKLQQCTFSSPSKNKSINIQTDQQQLRQIVQINRYKQRLNKKDQQIKKYRQQNYMKQIQCKKVLSQLDIQRIKFNLNNSVSHINKQIIDLSEKEQLQLVKEELKLQKQKNIKLSHLNQQKQSLIKKMSATHTNNISTNKKIRK